MHGSDNALGIITLGKCMTNTRHGQKCNVMMNAPAGGTLPS
jgi:hypothetical protein